MDVLKKELDIDAKNLRPGMYLVKIDKELFKLIKTI